MSRVTIKEVAKEAGVSTATVSRVLNRVGYASKEIQDRVYETVKRLHYQPNAVARSLKKDKTFTIGVVLPDISNPYFMTISKGIEDTIYKEGYNLIICSGDENPNKEQQLLELLYEKRVDMIVLATSGGNEDLIEQIHKKGIRIILMDRKLKDQNLELDLVAENDVQGAYELTKYLLKHGHTQIGVVNGSLNVSTGRERYEGYIKALNEFGLEEDTHLMFNGAFSQEGGRKGVEYFLGLSKKPSSIISFNNSMTFGVLMELFKRGFRVPKDIVVASYGEIEAAQLLDTPGIVFLKQSPYHMGERIGFIILERLLMNVKGPVQVILDTVLHVPNNGETI